jgi:hypothetical protein
VRLGLRDTELRHDRARLDGLRVAYPAHEIGRLVFARPERA